MPYCQECGGELPEDGTCPKCTVPEPTKGKGSGRTRLLLLVLAVAVLLGGCLACFGTALAYRSWTATVEVPLIFGSSPEEAEIALKSSGLKGANGGAQYDDDVYAGRILAQDPLGFTQARKRSTVTYWVSKGPEPVMVPNVTGLQYLKAQDILENRELGYEVSERADEAPPGEVIGQSPEASAAAQRDSTVTLTISTGPQADPRWDFTPAKDVLGTSEMSELEGAMEKYVREVSGTTKSMSFPEATIGQANDGDWYVSASVKSTDPELEMAIVLMTRPDGGSWKGVSLGPDYEEGLPTELVGKV